MSSDVKDQLLRENLGTRGIRSLPQPKFPDADLAVRARGIRRPPYKVDVLLVNPPTPDGAIWIRSEHRTDSGDPYTAIDQDKCSPGRLFVATREAKVMRQAGQPTLATRASPRRCYDGSQNRQNQPAS